MEVESYLTDVYGPRLTGSPNIKEAADWAQKTMKEWGLANVHLESLPFGRGWQNQRFVAHALTPRAYPLIGYPKAWTPGTKGPVSGDAVMAIIADRQGLRHVPRQAARQVRPRDGDARRAGAVRGARPSLHRRRARGSREAAGGRQARTRRARQSGRRGVLAPPDAVLDRRRRRRGARHQPAATAARSSCRAAARATRRVRRHRRRSCSPSSTTAASPARSTRRFP